MQTYTSSTFLLLVLCSSIITGVLSFTNPVDPAGHAKESFSQKHDTPDTHQLNACLKLDQKSAIGDHIQASIWIYDQAINVAVIQVNAVGNRGVPVQLERDAFEISAHAKTAEVYEVCIGRTKAYSYGEWYTLVIDATRDLKPT